MVRFSQRSELLTLSVAMQESSNSFSFHIINTWGWFVGFGVFFNVFYSFWWIYTCLTLASICIFLMSTFYMFIDHVHALDCKVPVRLFCPFLWGFNFVIVDLQELFIYSRYESFVSYGNSHSVAPVFIQSMTSFDEKKF